MDFTGFWAEFGYGKYLIVPFCYASAAYQARLVSPWVFWLDQTCLIFIPNRVSRIAYRVSCIAYPVLRIGIVYRVSSIAYRVSCIVSRVSRIVYCVSCIGIVCRVSSIVYRVSRIAYRVSCIGGISGEFGRAMVRILARRSWKQR